MKMLQVVRDTTKLNRSFFVKKKGCKGLDDQ